jgi:hypothetical protein
MQNTPFNMEPAALASAAGNILNCTIASLSGPIGITLSQPYLLVRHMRITNNDTANPHVVTIYKGANGGSAVGTEFGWAGYSLPAGSFSDWVGYAKIQSTDYITGKADTANKVTITIEGEVGFSL